MLFRDKQNKKYVDINFFDYTTTSDYYNEIMRTKFNHSPSNMDNNVAKNTQVINDIKDTLKKFI